MAKKAEEPKKRRGRPKKPISELNVVALNLIFDKRCKVCSHALLPEINQKLTQDIPNIHLAKTYKIPRPSIERHRINHLAPAIRNAEIERQRQLTLEVQTFADETYLSTLDKLKLIQERILTDLKFTSEQIEKNHLYTLWLKYLQSEAKILGLFSAPSKDSVEEINKRIAHLVKNQARLPSYAEPEGEVVIYEQSTAISTSTNKTVPDNQITNGHKPDHKADKVPFSAVLKKDNVFLAHVTEISEQIAVTFNFIYGQDLANSSEIVRILRQ